MKTDLGNTSYSITLEMKYGESEAELILGQQLSIWPQQEKIKV